MRVSVVALWVLLSLVVAQGEPVSNGVLSFIEDQPGSGEGLRRSLPFVEVIDTDALELCKEEGFDSPLCPEFEYSIPFIPKAAATEAERAIVDAWLRFETRSYYRTQLETGTLSGLLHCATGLGVVDLTWFFYTGELFFPAEDFCDDFASGVLPNCFLECDLPLAICPAAPAGCSPCVEAGMVRAERRKYSVYIFEYHEEVLQALTEAMPLGLLWQGATFVQGGSMLAPVMDTAFPTEFLELIQDVSREDQRAGAYFLQPGAYSNACQPVMPRELLSLLRALPTGDGNAPGIAELESLKRLLADRESAGDTYHRFPYWWLGQENIYPQFRRGTAGALGIGTPAIDAASLPLIHACFGYATFFQVYQQHDSLLAPHRLQQRMAKCYAPPFSLGLSPVPPVPVPWSFSGYRYHSDWQAVPEGYGIPRVSGTPRYLELP